MCRFRSRHEGEVGGKIPGFVNAIPTLFRANIKNIDNTVTGMTFASVLW